MDVKKIGIASLYTGSTNYGGCLQAYALCKVISDMGYDVKQISYKRKNIPAIDRFKRTIANKRLCRMLKTRIRVSIRRVCNRYYGVNNKINEFKNSFTEFRDSIPHTETIYNDDILKECTDFDIYITGSDQVWNLGETYEFSPFYWLDFVEKTKKKISYAASISMNNIPEKCWNGMQTRLSTFSGVSLREKDDVELINRIVGENIAEWVLDPTLLLTRDNWSKICSEKFEKRDKYIFAYILGDNISQRKTIQNFAKEVNLPIVTIPFLLGSYRKCDDGFGDFCYSNITPNDWISAIENASFVFTDSFHATVFSSIFRTPFFVFKRSKENKYSMNSRIYSYLDLIGCRERLIEDKANISSIVNQSSIDFETVDERLNKKRKSSIDFLKRQIGIDK